MTVKVYRELLPLVNDMDMLRRLIAYADYRIENLRLDLEIASTFEQARRVQGSLCEVRRLHTLRDEVLVRAK